MSFKSEAQRKKFREMLAKGDISQETYDEWEKATDRLKIPPRLEKPVPKRKARVHKARVK